MKREKEIKELAAGFGEVGHRSRSKPATFSVKAATRRLVGNAGLKLV